MEITPTLSAPQPGCMRFALCDAFFREFDGSTFLNFTAFSRWTSWRHLRRVERICKRENASAKENAPRLGCCTSCLGNVMLSRTVTQHNAYTHCSTMTNNSSRLHSYSMSSIFPLTTISEIQPSTLVSWEFISILRILWCLDCELYLYLKYISLFKGTWTQLQATLMIYPADECIINTHIHACMHTS